jgi:hypothetical protein
VDRRELTLAEMFTPAHVKHRFDPARHRFRPNTPDELLAAVREMVEALERPAPWTDAQTRYRSVVDEWLQSDQGRRRGAKAGLTAFTLGEGRIVDRYAAEHL